MASGGTNLAAPKRHDHVACTLYSLHHRFVICHVSLYGLVDKIKVPPAGEKDPVMQVGPPRSRQGGGGDGARVRRDRSIGDVRQWMLGMPSVRDWDAEQAALVESSAKKHRATPFPLCQLLRALSCNTLLRALSCNTTRVLLIVPPVPRAMPGCLVVAALCCGCC